MTTLLTFATQTIRMRTIDIYSLGYPQRVSMLLYLSPKGWTLFDLSPHDV